MTSRLFLSAAFIMGVQWSWGTGRTEWGVGGVEMWDGDKCSNKVETSL
jgi:hypothetical protein